MYVGILLAQTEAGKGWRKVWKAGCQSGAADQPVDMDANTALLAAVAVLRSGRVPTARDNDRMAEAAIVAVEIVQLLDHLRDSASDAEQHSYPAAMQELRARLTSGQLQGNAGQPLGQVLSWAEVVAVAELACALARPHRLEDWIVEQIDAAERGEPHQLDECERLAPRSTAKSTRRR